MGQIKVRFEASYLSQALHSQKKELKFLIGTLRHDTFGVASDSGEVRVSEGIL